MTTRSHTHAQSADDLGGMQEMVLERDDDRPLSFAGVVVARAACPGTIGDLDKIEATLYRTRGGKYVSALSRTSTLLSHLQELFFIPRDLGRRMSYSKAAVLTRMEDAVEWFPAGQLRNEIRRQTGLAGEPERID